LACRGYISKTKQDRATFQATLEHHLEIDIADSVAMHRPIHISSPHLVTGIRLYNKYESTGWPKKWGQFKTSRPICVCTIFAHRRNVLLRTYLSTLFHQLRKINWRHLTSYEWKQIIKHVMRINPFKISRNYSNKSTSQWRHV